MNSNVSSLVEIVPDMASLRALYLTFSNAPREADRACSRALNRTIDSGRTHAKRIISKELGIKQADLVRPTRFGATGRNSTGAAIRIKYSSPDDLEAKLMVRGGRIPVRFFKVRATPVVEHAPVGYPSWRVTGNRLRDLRGGHQWFTSRRRGSGVSWTIGSRTTFEERAFLGRGRRGEAGSAAESSTGTMHVFRRVGRKRLKIYEVKGPSIPHAMKENPEFRRAVQVDLSATFKSRVQHEMRWLTNKQNRGR